MTRQEPAARDGESTLDVFLAYAHAELPGAKHDGRWLLDGRNPPLTETQRRALRREAPSSSRGRKLIAREFIPGRPVASRCSGPGIEIPVYQLPSLRDEEQARRLRSQQLPSLRDEELGRVLEVGRGLYDAPAARALAGLAPGWPIGAYTSQLFAAHVYLNAFDHFVKRTLKTPGYVRYVDDLFLFGDRRADLRRWRGEVAGWLAEHRALRLKRPQARILSCRGHLDALGYRIRREGVQALPRALRRIACRAREAMLPPGSRPGAVDLGRSLAASSGVVLF